MSGKQLKLIEYCFNQLPISLFVNPINGVILVALLWGAIPGSLLGLWLLALMVVTLARYRLLRAFRHRHSNAINRIPWEGAFIAGAGLSGLVWGASGVLLMHPQSYPYQVLIAFALGGMIAGAVPILSCLPQAYIAFAVPTMLPVTLNMLLAGDRIHLNMGLLLLVFSLAMVLSSMRMSQTLLELCDLRLHRDLSNKERKTLERLLRIDEMTGIANRRCFDETIKLEWRRGQREGGNMALISADIDNFKEYNDLYGHPAGDSCLAQVAKAMQDALNRPGDLAARTGGEEFSFVLPNTSLQGAGYIAERLRNSVQALNIPHAGQPDTGKVTISVGVAACDHHKVDTLDSLVQLADEALYQAKRQGRNGVVLAT